jgi:hypothetical protein
MNQLSDSPYASLRCYDPGLEKPATAFLPTDNAHVVSLAEECCGLLKDGCGATTPAV